MEELREAAIAQVACRYRLMVQAMGTSADFCASEELLEAATETVDELMLVLEGTANELRRIAKVDPQVWGQMCHCIYSITTMPLTMLGVQPQTATRIMAHMVTEQ